jgi:hypothetical protein
MPSRHATVEVHITEHRTLNEVVAAHEEKH